MANKLYSCVLLDDELLALSYLRTLCEQIPDIQVTKAYNNPELFLREIENLQFDFLISDIVMPSLTGLEVADKLRGTPVIFTTAHNEYAAEAFDVEAIDYLRKPVQVDRLNRAIRKAIEQLQNSETKWITSTSKGKMSFLTREIVSLSAGEIDSRDKVILLSDGSNEVIKNKSFQQLTEELKTESFIRISKRVLFNIRFFHGHNSDQLFSKVKGQDGRSLVFSIGENYKKDVAERFKKGL